MKKFNDRLNNIFKNICGNVLCIGSLDDKFITTIEKNDDIKICNMMNLDFLNSNDKNQKGLVKKINIRNIKKKFKKKRINYTICNINDVHKYLRRFMKDSVYITKDIIYFYGDKSYDYKELANKYKRYNLEVEVVKIEDKFIVKIICSNKKYNKLIFSFYYFKDTIIYLADLISDMLIR